MKPKTKPKKPPTKRPRERRPPLTVVAWYGWAVVSVNGTETIWHEVHDMEGRCVEPTIYLTEQMARDRTHLYRGGKVVRVKVERVGK